ncbi:comEA protein [Streptococcus vestibularis ATCC 49124]|uniref:ComEA protein n=1 Tax=Streptococcus vestibularis ATCC 49124 TaxID=889206 RepID=A0ABN0CHY4_STRVE|nr:comEA protein [Streptococcus vestibularis ATCC 49124]
MPKKHRNKLMTLSDINLMEFFLFDIFFNFFTNKKENISIKETDVKEKIIDYVNNNRLFVSIIGVLMMVFCFFLWMTCGAGNSMEAETSYTDVTTLSTSSSKEGSKSLTEVSSQSQTEGSEKVKSKVTVDVKGAVVKPGVYTLKVSARVTDAIQEAGGMTEDADAKSVNLAASLSDEEVIYVANKDENVSVLDQSDTGQVSNKGGQAVSKNGKINLNTATSEQLQTISGIGAKRAEDIVAYRESHGGFQSVGDLKNVSGIGDKTLDKIRESIYVA